MGCNCKSLKCAVLIEVVTSGPVVSLPESNRIRDSHVLGIETIDMGYVENNFSNSTLYSSTGAIIATADVISSSYLSLKNANGTELVKINLFHLMRGPGGQADPLRINWTDIDPTQSTIIINTAATGYANDAVIPLTFWLECNNCGVPE